MATNAFVAYGLAVSPLGRPKDAVNLSKIGDRSANLLHLTQGFLQDIQKEAVTDKDRKQYLTVTDIIPIGDAVQFAGRYGPYGQSGNNIIDVQSGESVHELSDNDAFTTRVRNMLVVPQDSDVGLFLAERYAGRGLTSIFLREFGHSFLIKFRSEMLRLHSEGLTNGQEWKNFLAEAQLAQVRVIRHNVPQDLADHPNERMLYNLTYSAKPSRGLKFFPKSVRDGLLGGRIKPETILGLSGGTEFDETRLEMHGASWQKDFALDEEPVLVYAIGSDGDERPTDDEIYKRMEEVVEELCPTLGVDLASGWHEGTWSQEAQAVTMEAVSDS